MAAAAEGIKSAHWPSDGHRLMRCILCGGMLVVFDHLRGANCSQRQHISLPCLLSSAYCDQASSFQVYLPSTTFLTQSGSVELQQKPALSIMANGQEL